MNVLHSATVCELEVSLSADRISWVTHPRSSKKKNEILVVVPVLLVIAFYAVFPTEGMRQDFLFFSTKYFKM